MKWGILATGNIAGKFAGTVKQMSKEGEELIAVGSRRAENAETFALKYDIPKYYDSYEKLAGDEEVNAVYVATPNSMHYENCKMCLMMGKHVLCEKPFTINVRQAEELYKLAEEKGLFVMEALWTRFLPLYEKLRLVLAEGIIGEVKHVKCEYGFVAQGARRERKFRSDLGGGALLDIGIYNLGFLHLIMQEKPESFTSDVHMNEYGTDDYSRLELIYPGGRSAEAVQVIGRALDRNAVIQGTKGHIFLSDFQHAESMTVHLENGECMEMIEPVDINGFEYEIREVSKCVAKGMSGSGIYTPKDSMILTGLMQDIRRSWNMRFEGEG